MPHGGFKHSGYGKDLSMYGLEDYTRIKHVMQYHGYEGAVPVGTGCDGPVGGKGEGMADKGLKSEVVGLFGGTLLGISSVAPAYALTATLGILATASGPRRRW